MRSICACERPISLTTGLVHQGRLVVFCGSTGIARVANAMARRSMRRIWLLLEQPFERRRSVRFRTVCHAADVFCKLRVGDLSLRQLRDVLLLPIGPVLPGNECAAEDD